MIQSRLCMILWVITTLQYGDAFQVTSIVNPPNRERLLITPSIERVAFQQRSSSSVIWGKWQLGLSTASNDDEPDQEEQSSSTGSSTSPWASTALRIATLPIPPVSAITCWRQYRRARSSRRTKARSRIWASAPDATPTRAV